MGAIETGAAIAGGGTAVGILVGGEAGRRIEEASKVIAYTVSPGTKPAPETTRTTAAPPAPAGDVVAPPEKSPGLPWWLWGLVLWALSRRAS